MVRPAGDIGAVFDKETMVPIASALQQHLCEDALQELHAI